MKILASFYQLLLARRRSVIFVSVLLLSLYISWEVYWYIKVGPWAIKWHTYLVTAFLAVALFIFVTYILHQKFDLLRLAKLITSFMRKWGVVAGIGISYIILCLLIKEQHPFTLVPMYNHFEDYAYSIRLTDSKGSLIPLQTYYRLNGGDLTHKYYTIKDKVTVNCTPRAETVEDLHKIGRLMMDDLLRSEKKKPAVAGLQLHLICHYMVGDSILTDDRIIYERANEN